MGSAESRLCLEIIDLVLTQQEPYSLRELIGGVAAPGDDPFKIKPHICSFNSMLTSRASNQFHCFGGVQQCFGRDTSPVEANPSRLVTFDHGRTHFELTCAYGGRISAWTRPDDYEIVACRSQD